MKSILLNGAAALALVIGTSAVFAQSGPGSSSGGSSGTMQQNAPAASGGASGGAGGTMAPGGSGAGAGAQGGASTDCAPGAPGCGSDARGGASAQGQRDMKRDQKSGTNAQGEKMRDDKSGTSAQGAKDGKGGKMSEGRSAAAAEIGAEQKTKIHEHVRSEKIDRVNVDFNLNVGAALPANVHTHVHPVPFWLVDIVPAYRGYSYIVLADGRIVIIEPSSYEVVTIIS